MRLFSLLLIAVFANAALASTVAIIDSGVDMRHQDIKPQAWTNPNEIAGNKVDDDGNGLIDDVFGWNFAENNNMVIDYKYLGTFSQDPYKFFEIQKKYFLGTVTTEEKNWVKEKLEDQEFMKEISKFGNFIHGTHVAGISSKNAAGVNILAIKLIPTEVGIPGMSAFAAGVEGMEGSDDFSLIMIKMGLTYLAEQQMKVLIQIAQYVNAQGATVANGSFGTGYNQAEMIVRAIFSGIVGRDPTDEEVRDLSLHLLNALITKGKEMAAAAPNTLFVFAAGNDGNNNDVTPTSPANIGSDNTMAVAATFGLDKMPTFSNYGARTVEVAAPGTIIESAIPGNEYLVVSGTSQAAPFVSNVAGRVREINSDLRPIDVKTIIMGTVDKKEFLRGKVLAGGIVNPARAAKAAEYSKTFALRLSIEKAMSEVSDMQAEKSFFRPDKDASKLVLPLPTGFAF